MHGAAKPLSLLWDPSLFAVVALGISVLIGGGSAFKVAALSSGGHVVAELLGGRLIPQGTTDPTERRLLNVVEEVALASGVPVPLVYVQDNEPGINAFAAGNTTSDAVITVTRGTLQNLSRDELQGVIGHEFSHILNGDMRLNIRLMGVLFGILLIGLAGWLLFRSQLYAPRSRSSNDDNRGGNAILLIGIALYIIGYTGVFFANLIKAAVSRQREYLADASAVQFTRNPDGIAGALKKIGALAEGSHIREPHAVEASHMFFGSALSNAGSLFGLLDTHPPLADRIRRIDPSFNGDFSKVRLIPADLMEPLPRPAPGVPRQPARMPFDPTAVVAGIGAVGPQQIASAAGLIERMPESLTQHVRDPLGASGCVFALLLDVEDESVRAKQLGWLEQNAPASVVREARTQFPQVAKLEAESRFPLLELAIPALRQMSPEQYRSFDRNVQALVAADDQTTLFEFALERMLLRHLSIHFGLARAPKLKYTSAISIAMPTAIVLSALAHVGQSDPADIDRAYTTGLQALGWRGVPIEPRPGAMPGLKPLDAALNDLASAAPALKKQVLTACAACIGADNFVTVEESELLRAIADSLGCPMPPLSSQVG